MFAACFIGAMNAAAGDLQLWVPPEVAVTATVGIGPRSEGGFGLDVELRVHLPGLDHLDAERLVEAGPPDLPVFQRGWQQRRRRALGRLMLEWGRCHGAARQAVVRRLRRTRGDVGPAAAS